jgi:hypothetical protein
LFCQAFAKQFNAAPDDLDMHVIYDVSHNIAKIEEHIVDGKQKTLLVHRKVSWNYGLDIIILKNHNVTKKHGMSIFTGFLQICT